MEHEPCLCQTDETTHWPLESCENSDLQPKPKLSRKGVQKRRTRPICHLRKLNHTTLAQFLVDLVVKWRTDADIADLLDLAADAEFAPWACDQISNAIDRER
jgi:hypothetical protein